MTSCVVRLPPGACLLHLLGSNPPPSLPVCAAWGGGKAGTGCPRAVPNSTVAHKQPVTVRETFSPG